MRTFLLMSGLLVYAMDASAQTSENQSETRVQHDTTMEKVIDFLTDQIRARKLPGVSYTGFSSQQTAFTYHFGYSDLATGVKVNDNTLFHGFSVTKTMTAVAILQLAEQGKLSLDAALTDYLPHYSGMEDVTIRHLLSHTSGLPNPFPLQWIHSRQEDSTFNSKCFFQPILDKAILKKGKTGAKFRYSNLGYVLLGQVIEVVSGESYRNYIQTHVFQAVGAQESELTFMSDSTILQATGYHPRGFSLLMLRLMLPVKSLMAPAVGKWKPFFPYYINGSAYGGVVATANGLSKFGMGLLCEDSPLLSKESRELLFTANCTSDGTATKMCLAWFTDDLDGKRYVSHAGGGGGYYCELRLYPDLGKGTCLMMNTTGFNDKRLLDQLDRLLPASFFGKETTAK